MAEEQSDVILIVDDIEANVDVLVETLSDEFDVSVAMDGPTALEIANEDLPSLILLDIMMPGMDGYEVCEKLKSKEKTHDIPVIFVTAKGEVEDEAKGFEVGAVDYIMKPVSPPIVLSRVKSQLALKKKSEELLALSKKLSKYLAPQVYVSIFRGEQDARIESKRKKLTIFFSDIVSFTQTTEGMEAEDLSDLLNSYLEEMATIAIKHGGTIDKFIGDAVLIFFGDPLSRGLKEDALACVSMALEMRDTIKKLQEKWYSYGIQEPFKVRMGIATGYCTVGNFGSVSRMDYTIVGSQVNIASRLESSAEPDQIVISHETWSLVKDEVYCVKQKPIMVKGISHPIQTYQVTDFVKNITDEQKTAIIGLLAEPALAIADDITVEQLKAQMDASNPYEGAVVVKAKTSNPLGLIMGYQLENQSDLMARQIMDQDALAVEAGTALDQVIGRVMERDKNKAYDPIIVTENGDLKGIVPVRALLERMTD